MVREDQLARACTDLAVTLFRAIEEEECSKLISDGGRASVCRLAITAACCMHGNIIETQHTDTHGEKHDPRGVRCALIRINTCSLWLFSLLLLRSSSAASVLWCSVYYA